MSDEVENIQKKKRKKKRKKEKFKKYRRVYLYAKNKISKCHKRNISEIDKK